MVLIMDNEDNAILAEKLFTAIKTERKGDVEKYLCLGADPNCLLLNHITPFHLASGCSKSFDFVQMILEHGNGNPNVRDNDGLTPLHVATLWGKTDCVKLMVEHFGDIFARDNEGKDLRWYAKESGSEECLFLVEDLMKRNNNQLRTPRCTKQNNYSNVKKIQRNKENRTPTSRSNNFSDSPQELSILSPLHSQCNDSWVAKHRGSARQRFGSGSRDNSPNTSPLVTRAKVYYEQAENSPCHKEHYGIKSDDVNALTSNSGCILAHCHSPIATNIDFSESKECQKSTTPCFPRRHAMACLRSSTFCNSCAVLCQSSNVLNKHCNIEQISLDLCKACGKSNNDDVEKKLDTNDKCIGTSILELSDNKLNNIEMESVACQVTFTQKESPNKILEKSHSNISIPEDCTIGIKNEVKEYDMNTASKVISSFEDHDSYNSSMKEFLKSCVEGGKKGLDVSSPDHCLSFDLGQNSIKSSLIKKTRDACNIEQNENINSPKSRLKDESPSKFVKSSPSSRNMLLSTKVPLTDEQMLKYYGVDFLQSFSDKNETTTKTSMKEGIKEFNSGHFPNEEEAANYCDFTFSESTVPVVECEDADGSVFESLHISICEEKSSQSSVLLRKFAATNPSNSEVKQIEEKFSFSSMNDFPSATTNGRLHSTALHDTQNFEVIDENSFDISVIKAADPLIGDKNEKSDTNGEQSNSNDPSLRLHLSSTGSSDASSQSTIIYDWKSFWKGEPIPKSASKKTCEKKISLPTETLKLDEDLENLSNEEIRNQLVSLGCKPGPITASRNIYLKKLKSLINAKKMDDAKSVSEAENTTTSTIHDPKFSTELRSIIMGRSLPSSVVEDDATVRQQFENPDPNLQWREGTMKNSFTYLLLDPRVTDRLPIRAKNISEQESFKSFVGSIFYVGKGKQSRPYSHFHEALQTNRMLYKLNPSQKVRHIHDIWNQGLGVISLHIFQSIIACEAYTREASMIEAIGLEHLTNRKRGDFYGVAALWNRRRKRLYGSFLIKKAMEVLMVEGERQIRPSNLKSHNTRQWTGCNGPITSS